MPLVNVTLAEAPALKAELLNDPAGLGYAGTDVAGKATLLARRPLVANPAPRAQVPAPLALAALIGLLSPASLGNLWGPQGQLIADAVVAQNRDAVGRWMMVALAGGKITQAEYDALTAQLRATIADPGWLPQVPGPSRLAVVLGRDPGGISAAEVAALLNS